MGKHPAESDAAGAGAVGAGDVGTGGDAATCAAHQSASRRTSSRPPARINVTVALPTLLGLDDDPADLTGYGAIPAHVARDLAAHPDSTLRRLVVDPTTGALLGIDGHTFEPLSPTHDGRSAPTPQRPRRPRRPRATAGTGRRPRRPTARPTPVRTLDADTTRGSPTSNRRNAGETADRGTAARDRHP